MNCKRITELLPLYVGNDLGERDLKLVTEHVRSCENCASAADEYRQTEWMVKAFAPPVFSDDLYAGIRERVLNEIENEPARAMSSHLLATFFYSPVRCAAFAVLLVAVAFFSSYIIGVRENPDQRTSLTSSADPTMQSPIEPSRDDKSLRSSNGDNTKPGIISGGPDVHPSRRKRRFEKAAERPRARSAAQIREIMNAKTTPEIDLPIRDAAVSPAAIRMEIQTSDPNIRIIWFSPRPNKAASNNISKDS